MSNINFELTERKCEARKHARISHLLRKSRLPLEKDMETFDRKRLSTKLNAHIDVLINHKYDISALLLADIG